MASSGIVGGAVAFDERVVSSEGGGVDGGSAAWLSAYVLCRRLWSESPF